MNTVVKPLHPCHRCGGELYLAVTAPHPTMPGDRLMVLCPQCDADDPDAQELLAWFAIYSVVDTSDLADLEVRVGHWVAAMQERPTGVYDLDADVEAWHRGDYD